MSETKVDNHSAVAGQVDCRVRPAVGVVLARDGLPTLVVRGNESAHVQHAGARYLYDEAALYVAIAAAWRAGYWHNGYTDDAAYADAQAEALADELLGKWA